MVRFRRKLTKKITNTGTCYTLAIPREIAEALRLEDGGLVSLRIWSHRNEVLMQNYQDSPHPVREVFSPAQEDFIEVEAKPNTHGPSRSFGEYQHVDFKVDIREIWASLRWLKAQQRAAGITRRRRRC